MEQDICGSIFMWVYVCVCVCWGMGQRGIAKMPGLPSNYKMQSILYIFFTQPPRGGVGTSHIYIYTHLCVYTVKRERVQPSSFPFYPLLTVQYIYIYIFWLYSNPREVIPRVEKEKSKGGKTKKQE